MSPHRCWIALLALLLAGAGLAPAATFPPEYRFSSLRTPRVTLHFHQGLEPMAREAAAMADEIVARHEARYGYRLGRVQIVLADNEDDPNGFSTPLPYPMVHLRAAAPDGSDDFGNLESWLRLLLTHELAHNIHIDQARGLFRLGRRVFGRAPFLFPNGITPQWQIEGLATYEETEGTAFGRGRNPDSIMVRRMAALEGVFPGDDKATTDYDRWPLGQTAYLFGEAFVRELTRRFGEDTLPRIARVHSSWPAPFFDELTGRRVTGKLFHARWQEFARAETERFRADAASIRSRGLTTSRALTTRGVRQIGPRVSPDGRTIAFTSSTLSRRRAIRLLARESGAELTLVERNGGAALAWTPDGKSIVYDDVEVRGVFANRYDLKVVDVESGRTRWLTQGARGRDPDVSPDGTQVVFVRREPDRSDLALVGMGGGAPRPLTRSETGVQWSGPVWHPEGHAIVASRWQPGGWCDLVRIDVATGALVELGRDRAREVEPAWTPDGRHLVFRSDRDGVSNIYARRESDGALLRVTRVLGGAFTPAVDGEGRLVFASYGARGYDLHEADVAWSELAEADPFVDRYPPSRPPVVPAEGPATPYRPYSTLLPRFWAPYLMSGDDTRVGVITGGADPLYRHAWGLESYRAMESGRFGGSLFYRYARFRPELTLSLSQNSDLDEYVASRKRAATARITCPLARTRRTSQQLSLAWRVARTETGASPDSPEALTAIGIEVPLHVQRSSVEVAWTGVHDVQQFPDSISPSHGERLRVAVVTDDRSLGSDFDLVRATADARLYRRVFGDSDVLALRVGGGTTLSPGRGGPLFSIGGFPDGSTLETLYPNQGVLRGYRDGAFLGRHYAHVNLEYRVPLADPQRGFWSLPFFWRHVHAAAFADAGHAWTPSAERPASPLPLEEFRLRAIKTSVGAALGTDLYLVHGLPFTATAGVAYGFADQGGTRGYVRFGLAF